MDTHPWLWLIPPVLGVVVFVIATWTIVHWMKRPSPLTDEDIAEIEARLGEMERERDGDIERPVPPRPVRSVTHNSSRRRRSSRSRSNSNRATSC